MNSALPSMIASARLKMMYGVSYKKPLLIRGKCTFLHKLQEYED